MRHNQEVMRSILSAIEPENEQTRQMLLVTQEMLSEPQSGPITRATMDGQLNSHSCKGKSAEQIIDFCYKLYGETK